VSPAPSPARDWLDDGGNRRINSVLYIASATQQGFKLDARGYLDPHATRAKRTARSRNSSG
jgi:hypothetical protein